MGDTAHRQQSPLVTCHGTDSEEVVNDLGLKEIKFFTHLNVRADNADNKLVSTLSELMALDLPTQPNRCVITESRRAFWLSPDEWLIVFNPSDADSPTTPHTRKSATDIDPSLASHHFALTDVSGGQTIFQLTGNNARAALQRGCPLDTHPSVFLPGHCAQTHINHINVLLWSQARTPDPESSTYFLIVRRSFADYLWRWLQQVRSRLA